MSLLVGFGLLVLLAVAATLFGAESREGFVSAARPRRWFIRF